MKNNGILLINHNTKPDSGLEKVLLNEKYDLRIYSDNSFVLKDLENFMASIILCHTDGNDYGDTSLFEIIKKLNPLKKIPVVFISPVIDAGKYFKEFESDMVCHINTPCSKDYLISKLNSMVSGKTTAEKKGNLYSLKFSYNDNEYDISLSRESIENLILSLIENNIQQNLILNDIIFNDTKVTCVNKNSEILESKYICPESEDIYENGVHDAFEKKEFRLFYQPVMSIMDNLIYGFEALIRWERNKIIISPNEFIPLLESTMLITKLGTWIADEASRQLKVWQEEFDIDKKLHININLSPKQFEDPGLCDKIFKVITGNGISPENIGVEVTENVIMEDREAANLMLLKFKSKGFNLYMDDFGTGYSSLTYLLHYPFDVIKIDKSFVQWMHFDRQSEEIVRSVVAMSHNLNKIVVAEGVELVEHLNILKEIKCDYYQGYHFSKPLDSVSAGELIRKYLAAP